jgi:hypothetical protein
MDLSKGYFDEIWPRIQDVLTGTGYKLNYMEETSLDILGEQILVMKFHRNPLTILEES